MWPMLQSLWLALSRKLARKAAPGRRPAFRPLRVEALEDRTVPSAASLAAYGQLPLSFEANQGQTAAQVNFLSRGQGYTLFLAPSEAVLALSQGSGGDVLQMQLVGVNSQTPAVGLDQQAGVSNYFLGDDPSQWRRRRPQLRPGRVPEPLPRHRPGLLRQPADQLEYDFDGRPGASPAAIQLAFQGAQSA